jgi:hypothetical protein
MNEDNKYYSDIIKKVGPTIEECYHWQKQIFKGNAPQSMLEGMVLGFLLARGFTYEESTVGLVRYSQTIKELIKKDPSIESIFKNSILTMHSKNGIEIKE